jgi:hypothetical protein
METTFLDVINEDDLKDFKIPMPLHFMNGREKESIIRESAMVFTIAHSDFYRSDTNFTFGFYKTVSKFL